MDGPRNAMTSRRDENESFEGIHLDLPFVSLKMGRGWGAGDGNVTHEDDDYERARRRVHAKLSLYRHVATAAAVLAAVIFIDVITGGGVSTLVLWIAGIWGAILLWQAFNVWVFPLVWSQEAEEKMIQDELRRQRNS
jgi:fatty acid desaturase